MKKTLVIVIILISFGCLESKKSESNTLTTSHNEISSQKYLDSTKVSKYMITDSEIDSFKPMVKKLSEYETQELKDLPNYIRLTLSIIVPFDITKESLENTMKSIVYKKSLNDNELDEIMIFAYDDKNDIGKGYTFGKLLWAPKGMIGNATPEIAKNNNRSNYKFEITIKDKVGKINETDLPTKRELDIYNEIMNKKYWDMQEEESEPLIMNKFKINKKELDEIWLKVAAYKN